MLSSSSTKKVLNVMLIPDRYNPVVAFDCFHYPVKMGIEVIHLG